MDANTRFPDRDASHLRAAVDDLRQVISSRLGSHFRGGPTSDLPATTAAQKAWPADLTNGHLPDSDELIILLLALVPHLEPGFFTRLIAEHLPEGGDFPEFGGVRYADRRDIVPTGETAQFVLGGGDLEQRLRVCRLLDSDHWFAREHILWLEPVSEGDPAMSGRLMVGRDFVERITTGTVSRPRFSTAFPAEYIQTQMSWDDLVLPQSTLRQIREIEHWIQYNDTVLQDWAMKTRIKAGYRALFHGPPGTGKTLTATLLGKHIGQDVFRIDLSRVVSKYIGETEKNLSRLFDRAEHKDWILFFDEADALFGKRTDIRDAHDKYANQEVSFLLQRIEGYNGLVILATNQRGNIDDAFVRRFQSVIHFPMPRAEERHVLWQKTFPRQIQLADDINWQQIAARHELSGAGILNIAHYCALQVLAKQAERISLQDLETAISREYVKEGRLV